MSAFWSGRRVFVTGHTGFKGSWLCLWLARLGAEVTGFALDPPSSPSLFQLARVSRVLRDVRGDVREPAALGAALAECDPDVVFHLAAQPLVRAAYRDPGGTFATNVLGTVNLLEALRERGRPAAVVVVTSDKCYQPVPGNPRHRECDPLGGTDPYSASKACAEIAVMGLRDSLAPGVQVASARAGNAIGGGDFAAERLVPDLVRAFCAGKAAPLRSPGAVRPWQHVLEPLRGYLRLAERLAQPGSGCANAWNFGPRAEDERSVAELAQELALRWGPGASWRAQPEPDAPAELPVLRLDATRAQALGWAPRWGLARALDETVAWYRALELGADLRHITVAQIDRYQEADLEPLAAAGAGE